MGPHSSGLCSACDRTRFSLPVWQWPSSKAFKSFQRVRAIWPLQPPPKWGALGCKPSFTPWLPRPLLCSLHCPYLCCCQHFVAYTLDKEPPRLSYDPDIDIWHLRQTYFPAFEATVKRAKTASIMCRCVPCCLHNCDAVIRHAAQSAKPCSIPTATTAWMGIPCAQALFYSTFSATNGGSMASSPPTGVPLVPRRPRRHAGHMLSPFPFFVFVRPGAFAATPLISLSGTKIFPPTPRLQRQPP